MKFANYARYMLRESRGSAGRLLFFVACLALGVAAVVAVAGLSSGMDRGIRSRARELLGADLVVESRRALPKELDDAVAALPGGRRTDVREFVTVVAAHGSGETPPSALAQLRVVDGDYPFYGRLVLVPDRPLGELLGRTRVVVARSLGERLELDLGDPLTIGGVQYEIAGWVLAEPDSFQISFTAIAPRVFLAPDGLARTGLETVGSRIVYRALIRLGPQAAGGDVEAAAEAIRTALPDSTYVEIETYAEAQPSLRRSLELADRYLGLVALLSLLIGGVGVTQTVRAWIAGRLDAIAVLRCLGLRPGEVLRIYLGQTALLGLAGSLVGALAGIGTQWLVSRLFEDLIPPGLIDPWQVGAILRGALLGVGVAILFSLAPLASIRRVPPARVLRREAEPLPIGRVSRVLILVSVLGGIFAAATVQSRSAGLAASFTVLLFALSGILALAAWLLTRAIARLPRSFGRVWLRHGVSALARPGAATLSAIVALGLGVVVVLGMYLVESRLSAQLDADLPQDAPSVFLVDIQPDQWPGVRGLLEQRGAAGIDSVPVVNARLSSVDGVPVARLLVGAEENRGRRWTLTREQRLTYLDRLPDDNRILDGALWADPGLEEISVEAEFAKDMGASVGSRLVFDVQGVPLELAVTSIRSVDWESFGINFFLVVEPGVLEQAPQLRVAAARISPAREQLLQDALVERFPNVTVIRIRDVLEKVVAVLRQVGLGVRLLGGFTVLAGILILAGAIGAGSVRRGHEVALLKTLGMTRRGVVAVYSVEYGLIGLVAGIIGVAGGGLVAWAVTRWWIDVPWRLDLGVLGAAFGCTVLLAVAAGVGASVRALAMSPAEALRRD